MCSKKIVLWWAIQKLLVIVYASYLNADAHILSAYNTQLYTTTKHTHTHTHAYHYSLCHSFSFSDHFIAHLTSSQTKNNYNQIGSIKINLKFTITIINIIGRDKGRKKILCFQSASVWAKYTLNLFIKTKEKKIIINLIKMSRICLRAKKTRKKLFKHNLIKKKHRLN